MDDKNRKRPDNEYLHKIATELLSHDKVMIRCVFGEDQRALADFDEFDDLRAQTLPLIIWMGNLITLAGTFLYAKFNQWRTETGAHPTDKERPNAIYLKRLLSGVQSTDAYFDQASSGLRVLRVLDGLYDSFDMNFLVIKYIIINSQIEAGFNSKKKKSRGLSRLIGFPHEDSLRVVCDPDRKRFDKEGCNLAAAFNFISVYRSDPMLKNTYDLYPSEDIECAFEDVFKTMEFMKRVKLDIDSEGNVNFIETTADGREKYIPSHGVMRAFETKNGKGTGVYKSGMALPKNFTVGFYLLERMEYLSDIASINAGISFLYQSFDESDTVSVYFCEKEGLVPEDYDFVITPEKSAAECFKRISGYLPGTRSTSSFFRGMIQMHYRHHNVLAPSIVDAIDEDRDAKVRVLKQFVKIDETPFKEAMEPTFKTLEFALDQSFQNDWESKIEKLCDYILSDEYRFRRIIDWDTLIARILIYEGPSKIIKTVLLHDEIDEADETKRKKIYETKDKEQIEKVCDQIIAGLEMRYIDNIFDAWTVSQKQEENYAVFKPKIDRGKNLFPGDYATKIECKALAQSYIDTIVNALTKIEKKNNDGTENKFAENSIQDTLEILKERNSSNANRAFLGTITAFLSFYAGIFESCRSRMSYEFEKSATILSLVEIEKMQSKIEDEFFLGVSKKASDLSKDFCGENAVELALKHLWDFAQMSVDDIRYYYAVLARAPINDAKLERVFRVNNGNIIFTYRRGEEFDFEQAQEEGIIIECLENVVRFLAGDDLSGRKERNYDKSNYMGYKEHAKKVIYPQIVTFAKHREDCDANDCLIMDHSGALTVWHKGKVQILTEFKYTINQSYYAMPNLNRIETEWWVDPILVSCYKFDEEIRKALAGVDDAK